MKELILLVCFVMTSLAQKDDFLATMPRELRPGMEYHIEIAYPTPPRLQVIVYARIRQLNTETSPFAWSQPASSSGEVVIAAGSYMGRITLQVPNSLIPETKYYMFLSFKEDPNQREVTFGSGKEIVVATTPSLMFVQADRGIYKPSTSKEETIVRLRVLRVDEGLKPVMGDNLKLEIRDPKDNIVMKQDNFGNDGGLAEASYSVPRDPFFGTYIAKAEGDWGKANTTFEVAEYVLPKFEVQLELDKSFVVDPFYFGQPNGDVDITGTVKAVYTYGAYVKGTMKITVGNVEETFNNFDGKEEFTIRISRSQDDLKQLKVFAEMTEEHTEDTANATQPFSIYDAEYRALVIKPIPNTVQGDAEYKFFAQLVDASGKRVENIQDFRWSVRAEMKYNQQTYTESVYGSLDSNPVEITLSPDITKGKDAYYSNITVSFDEIDSQGNIGHASLSANFTPTKYQSNTNQALFINIVNKTTEKEISNTETYKVESSEVCFKVRRSGTELLGTVFYQVIGNFYPDPLSMILSDITCVTIRQHMAPKAMIIAYTLVTDGTTKEYLAASVTFEVLWTSPHKVSITIDPPQARPNDHVTIKIQTEGQALVGLDGIDKSILYLADVKSISEARIQKRLGEFSIFGQDDDQGSNFPGPMPMFRNYMPFPRGPETTSAGAKIKDAGLQFISNVDIFGDSAGYCCDGPIFLNRVDADVEFKEEGAGGSNNVDDKAQSNAGENESKPPQQNSIRKDFPETWLYDIVETNPQGKKDLQKRCPGTITTFIVNGYAMNAGKGLGVAETVQLKCFQEFFVRANLPYSIKTDEDFDFQMLVFNYYTEAITVRVSLKEDPRIFATLGDSSTELTVQPGSSEQFKVPIKPSKIGVHDVTVNANWIERGISDTVVKTLRVEPRGKEIRVFQEQQVQVKQGETQTAAFWLDRFFTESAEYIVSESLKMEIQVTGDMIGTFINNLDGNMPMPTGCGEQNMITVIPSIFVAKYLKSLNRFTVDIREKVAQYCAKGYAKELIYKHRDGSYSAFGEGPGLCGCMFGDNDGGEGNKEDPPMKPGSSWLTAFVLYVFSIMGEQQLTYVNHEILGESFTFLKNTYTSGGSSTLFGVVGKVIHEEMEGGTSASGVPYSAYVLLAFTEYKKFLDNTPTATQAHKQEVSQIIDTGVQWLLSRTGGLTTKFKMAIVALVLARNGRHNEARSLLAQVESATMVLTCPKPRYSSGDIIPCWYAKDRNTECDPTNRNSCSEGLVCCITDCQGYRCVEGAGPSMVETKGYTALAYLALDDFSNHLDKIKPHTDWLLRNRQGDHYDNTQDTAVALQALAEYASKFPDQAVADFTVSVPANSPVTSPVSVVVNSDNYEILQTSPLNVQWTSDIQTKRVTADVSGNFGTAFVTLSVIYHSTNEKQVRKVIELTVHATKPVNGTTTHIKPCWRGRRPVTETDPKLGTMVVLEVSLQSGKVYRPEKVDLRELEIAGVTKIETDIDRVVLYFEPEEKNKYDVDNCVYLPVETEIEVRNQALGKAKVYDYYRMSESEQEAFYATEDCYVNCGPSMTTQGPTTGASSIYISGALLVGALLTALALFRKE